jgi:hypothetical protein
MKKLSYLLSLAMILGFFSVAQAQQSKKQLEKQLKEKSIKDARKQAKKAKKEGWYVPPGALPLDKQLERSWMKRIEADEESGFPKYYVAEASALAGTASAAKLQATTIAKQALAGQISSSIAAIIETNIATEQMTADEAATIQETVSASTELISQKLGRVITLTELYRKNKASNIEASVTIAYNQKMAQDMAKQAIKDKLEDKSNIAREKLDKLMNF